MRTFAEAAVVRAARWLRHAALALAVGWACIAVARALDLNTANRAQLEQLPRVGVDRAEAILKVRSAGGPFASWDDFRQRVPGFGEKSVKHLQAAGATIEPVPAAEAPARP